MPEKAPGNWDCRPRVGFASGLRIPTSPRQCVSVCGCARVRFLHHMRHPDGDTPSRSAVCAMASCPAMSWVPYEREREARNRGPNADRPLSTGNGHPVGNLLTALAGEKKNARRSDLCHPAGRRRAVRRVARRALVLPLSRPGDDHLRAGRQRAFTVNDPKRRQT